MASRGFDHEWVGGLIPMGMVERGQDGRPAAISCAIWLELPDLLVVAQRVVEESLGASMLGGMLADAVAEPLAGSPRPLRVRVASAALATGVRAAVGLSIPVVVAPTPELDEVRESMERFFLERAKETPRPAAAPPRPGRNDPCPCGSGRKYKRCHFAEDQARAERDASFERSHRLDNEAVAFLGDWASLRFPDEWGSGLEVFADPIEAIQLAAPWMVYSMHVAGRPVCEHYLAEHGRKLDEPMRAWIVRQREVWLSVWEVTAVEPGKSFVLTDLLSGEVRNVREVMGSESLVRRDCMLARVVPLEGVSILCGAHPRPLPSLEAADVVRRARAKLRRQAAVPVERLRDDAFGRYLIRRWEEAADEYDVRRSMPLDLRNTDGDAFVLTVDHFALGAGADDEVTRRLAALEGARLEEDEERRVVFLRTEPDESETVVGRVRIDSKLLRAETTSRERADALRARIEAACAALVQHRLREHMDPLSSAVQSGEREPARVPTAAEREAILAFKTQHYERWIDEPIPALDGRTPRESSGTAAGRRALDVLLRDMENHEQRVSPEARFDFAPLRKSLGLGD